MTDRKKSLIVAIFMVGGIWGALATRLLASAAVNPSGADGLFLGNPRQLGVQAIAVVAAIAFSFIRSTVLLKLTDLSVGLRVGHEAEGRGLDLSEHEERAYAFES